MDKPVVDGQRAGVNIPVQVPLDGEIAVVVLKRLPGRRMIYARTFMRADLFEQNDTIAWNGAQGELKRALDALEAQQSPSS